jgi:hypothetical protein
VWFCPNKKYLCKLESTQRRATKYILNDYNMDYKTRLAHCGLMPLSLRRQFLDTVFLYNSLTHLNDMNISLYMETVNMNDIGVTRLQNMYDELMFKSIRTKTELYSKFYTKRIINLWNSVPYEIRSLELTDYGKNTTFKNALKNWFMKYFLENFISDNTCTWVVKCICKECKLT